MLREEFEHPVHGRVEVWQRSNATRMTARWKGGRLSLSVPQGVSEEAVRRFADSLSERFVSRRPDVSYRVGQVLRFPGLDIEIGSQGLRPGAVAVGAAAAPRAAVLIGTALDPAAPQTTEAVSRAVLAVARRNAEALLLPRARALAARVGCSPGRLAVSSGHRVLGHCSSRGVVALSYLLVLLPQELRDYVTLHELAHLSEMNHSPRFHAVLKGYLAEIGKCEEELALNLRNFKWPIWRR